MSQAQPAGSPRQSVPKIRARKGGEPIVCLTAYTRAMAELLDPQSIFSSSAIPLPT